MTSGWGVDATVNGSGVVTSGTESSDVRKVWGALYSPGVVSGATITRSASAMTYTVASGVVAIQTVTGEVVMAPVQGTTLTVAAPPGTGSRFDVIFAQQRFPSDGDSYSIYRFLSFTSEAGISLPSNSQEIKRYQVLAGPANTNAAVIKGGVNYSIPYGASLGRLHYYQYASGIGSELPQFQRVGAGSFWLPTDRRVRFKVHAVMGASNASGFDNSKYCEYGFIPSLNNADFILWSSGGLHQAWQTHYFETTVNAPQGENTCSIILTKIVGPGTPVVYKGAGGDGYGRTGIEFTVEDVGPAI